MGDHDVLDGLDDERLQSFTKALLDDLVTLEELLESGRIEQGVRRIGAEQEMFLVSDSMQAAPVSMEVIERANDPRLTTELARFNLEANLSPQLYGPGALLALEREAVEMVALADEHARHCGARVLLCGILPSLRKGDLSLDNMAPLPRYRQLNDELMRMRGGSMRVSIKGLDELEFEHDNVMLEACNTSFQIHFQTGAGEFAPLYNLAQVVSAPVLAAAVNSPVLLGQRLWNETRVALFQRSVDGRSSTHLARGHRPRVRFGDQWLNDSILEIFREDVARFRVVLASELESDPPGTTVPTLRALRLHNGTVWRWNRGCYGILDGKPHLRIENRILPSGPTILDEIANAAFFFGLMSAMSRDSRDIRERFEFDDVKNNFFAASRHGLNAQLSWERGATHTCSELILDELLPCARQGLTSAGFDAEESSRYLDVIEERVRSTQTGSRWVLQSLAGMGMHGTNHLRDCAITAAMLENQGTGEPVSRWPLARLQAIGDWHHGYQRIEQFMSTDLFTVRPGDLVDLAASVMDWEHLRHVPVEDDQGKLVGLVSHRALLRLVSRGGSAAKVTVASIMKPDPLSVGPSTPTLEALELMRVHRVGCLPVVSEDGHLVGVVTEHDFLTVAARLLEEYLRA